MALPAGVERGDAYQAVDPIFRLKVPVCICAADGYGYTFDAGFIAGLVVDKLAYHLPLYRQEAIFQRLGVDIPRATFANWMIQCGQLIQPLINLLHDDLLTRDIILADETPLQVLKEPGRAAQTKSYLWCYRSGCGDQQ